MSEGVKTLLLICIENTNGVTFNHTVFSLWNEPGDGSPCFL